MPPAASGPAKGKEKGNTASKPGRQKRNASGSPDDTSQEASKEPAEDQKRSVARQSAAKSSQPQRGGRQTRSGGPLTGTGTGQSVITRSQTAQRRSNGASAQAPPRPSGGEGDEPPSRSSSQDSRGSAAGYATSTETIPGSPKPSTEKAITRGVVPTRSRRKPGARRFGRVAESGLRTKLNPTVGVHPMHASWEAQQHIGKPPSRLSEGHETPEPERAITEHRITNIDALDTGTDNPDTDDSGHDPSWDALLHVNQHEPIRPNNDD